MGQRGLGQRAFGWKGPGLGAAEGQGAVAQPVGGVLKGAGVGRHPDPETHLPLHLLKWAETLCALWVLPA